MKLKKTAILILFIAITFPIVRCTCVETQKSELQITIGESRINTIISIEVVPRNVTTEFRIILPFPISTKLAHFPSESLCSFEIIDNTYTVFSIIAPEDVSLIEVTTETKMSDIIKEENDWHVFNLSFNYENAPRKILMIIHGDDVVTVFDVIRITFPKFLDTNKIMESPNAFEFSPGIRSYNMSDVLERNDGKLAINYPVIGVYWLYQMIFSAIFSSIPAIGLLKIHPKKDVKTRFLYLFPLIGVVLWASFSTVMLFVNGPTWDHLPVYYGGLMVIGVAMLTWLRDIFGKSTNHTSEESTTNESE